MKPFQQIRDRLADSNKCSATVRVISGHIPGPLVEMVHNAPTDIAKLLEALDLAVSELKDTCYCHNLHPDYDGKCASCNVMDKIKALEK